MRVGDRKIEIKEIKRFMKEKKITQKELSLMSNVPLQTIKYILTERTTNPCIDTMQGNKKSPRRNRGRKFRKFYCTQRARKRLLYAYNLLSEAMKEHLIVLAENAAHVPSVKQNRA